MKNRVSKAILFLIFAFSLTVNAKKVNELTITLTMENDTLRLLDPWVFNVEVKNTSNFDIDFMPTMIISGYASISAEIKLEIRNSLLNSWVDSKVIINQCSPHTGFKIYKLKPNELIRYEFYCAPPVKFLEIGQNEIRIAHANFCDSGNTYYSFPNCIQIVKYENQDSAACEYLKKLPNPAFILFPVISFSNDTLYIKNAEHLILHFPDSHLAEYGKLYLSYQYLRKANYIALNNQGSKDEALYYLRNSKKLGVSLLTSQNNRILEKTHSLLERTLLEAATRAYKNYEIPDDITKEFTFPFKH
ncbi:MAG: hypothetical protein ACKVT2_11210 [Saprospiraceae bacterium]